MQKVNIVISTNDAYAKHAGVVIASIVHNTSSDLHFFIFTAGLNEENTKNLSKCAGAHVLEIVKIDVDIFSAFKVDLRWGYITIETCFRYLIAELCPEASKAIYLDCDLVVLDDIANFYSTEISNYYAAAVNENGDERPNFNAGVMLFNCDEIRRNGLTKIFFEKSKEISGKSTLLDQDVLNEVLRGKVKFVSAKWNVQSLIFGRRRNIETNRLSEILLNPSIVHFSGSNKPWKTPSGAAASPYAPAYFYYLRQTPYAHLEAGMRKEFSPTKSFLKFFWRNPAFFLKRNFRIRKYCAEFLKKKLNLS